MAETKWTPGPWAVRVAGHRINVGQDRNGRYYNRVAEMATTATSNVAAEGLANAALIAAAPDLYEALQAMVTMQEQMARRPSGGGGVLPADYGIVRGKAHVALAKARGEQ